MKPIAILITLAVLAGAQQRFDHVVRNDFFAGFGGNKEALERALKLTSDILEKEPNHAEALVWHGAGIYYLSGQAFQAGDQTKGMELYEKGVGEMDKAVALAPKNVGVRIPRGAVLLSSTLYMPAEFARPLVEKGLTDYETAYDQQQARLDALPEHPKGELLMGLASAHNRLGNADRAREFYAKVVEQLPGSNYATKAAKWIETGKLAPREQMCMGCHVQKAPVN